MQKSQLYAGYSSAANTIEALEEGLKANGFACVTKANDSLFFGAMTINNLPILFELKYESMTGASTIVYRVPVPPIKELVNDCIHFSLTR